MDISVTIQPKDIKNFNRLVKFTEKRFNDEVLTNGKYLISAMIIDKNRFSLGFNDYIKTHPFTLQNHHHRTISKHAEIDALIKWNKNWDISNATIYLCGLTNSGNFCISSKPCSPCLNKLKISGIKRIIYSNYIDDKFILNSLFI